MTEHDLIFERARIVDGTGAPWFRGTVAVDDGRISVVTRNQDSDLSGCIVVDVEDNIVAPGFIDLHSHSDLELFDDPTLSPKLRQGITTEILGQDGFSMAPMYRDGGPKEWTDHLSALAGEVDTDWTWGSVEAYLKTIEEQSVALNVGTLVGHGTVRYNVLGMTDRAPSDEELAEMADLVTEALEQGALGFSTGLVYPPQVNASTQEMQTLASRLYPYGQPFVAHIRSEGRWIWDALDEFVDIGAEEDIPLHLSHFKVSGSDQQGKAERANHLIEAARERGVDFTAEQYPYTAGNTMLSSVLPPWVHSDGPDKMLDSLEDEETRARIKQDIEEWNVVDWENPAARTGWENIVITDVDDPEYATFEGRDIASLADEQGCDPVDIVCDVLVAEELGVSMILHSMSETDVQEIMANERVAVATDGLFGGRPHPRVYGTYPRVLGRYVRELNHLTLEEAVRKMTSLPARVIGLESKGIIREGMDGDIVVFDPATVGSLADYDDPARYPRGIEHVLVDGRFVVRDGEVTGETPGDVIRSRE